jgi:hypothetical protein
VSVPLSLCVCPWCSLMCVRRVTLDISVVCALGGSGVALKC